MAFTLFYAMQSALYQLVDSQSGPELRLKPGGLRRHYLAAVGNVGKLLH